MGKAQRTKGQVAEREIARMLSAELGQVVERRLGQERDGGCDLIVETTAGELAIQVKRVERASVPAWLDQAVEDAGPDQLPVVAWRQSRRGWCVVMQFEDWCTVLREAMPVSEPEAVTRRFPEDFIS